MKDLVALAVVLLPPADVTRRAIDLSEALPAGPADALRLGPEHAPHVTLTQQFVRGDELEVAFERIGDVLAEQAPLRLKVAGGGVSGSSVWMVIEPAPELVRLHERLMESLRGVERQNAGPSAFVDEAGRVGDVLRVTGYRLKSSFGEYRPHITLGHGDQAPAIEPFAFEGATAAACHLGRFCTCRRVLRRWTLPLRGAPAASERQT